MNVSKTERGFEIIRFFDRNDQCCSLQQSSAIADWSRAEPGESAVWLGVRGHRMHLNREQVANLIFHLNAWMARGTFHLENNDQTKGCSE